MSIKYYKSKNLVLTYLAELEEENVENTGTSQMDSPSVRQGTSQMDSPQIRVVCNRAITKYFVMDDYQSFMSFIKKCNKRDFYEFIPADKPVCFYYDIEIYKEEEELESTEHVKTEGSVCNYYDDYNRILDECIRKVEDLIKTEYENVDIKKIILESHSDIKRSFHVILRFFDKTDNKEIVFENVQTLKELYKNFGIDISKFNSTKFL